MAYEKTNWTTTTPITVQNLNKIEEGIHDISVNGSGGDTLPIGAIVEYDGDTVPEGYEECEIIYDNYIDGTIVPTNEYLNGKRIFSYRFQFSQALTANTEYTFDLPFANEVDFAWVDLSNSYIDNSKDVSDFNVHCFGSTSGFQFRVSVYSKSKIVILADDTWGSNWTYTVMVKFTKKGE